MQKYATARFKLGTKCTAQEKTKIDELKGKERITKVINGKKILLLENMWRVVGRRIFGRVFVLLNSYFRF